MKVLRAGALVAALVSAAVHAQEVLLRDPWVPDAVKQKRSTSIQVEPTRGAALRAQVERKLRESFDAADVDGRGSITQPQARAAGLGLVAREFARIDGSGNGRITFDDYRRFLRAQGAAL